MPVRLGFVGVGKWAQKLATAFLACGAEIVAYDRQNAEKKREWGVDSWVERVPMLHGFGSYMPWRDQLADKSIDAIVAVAPPEITTEVALVCATAGKPVCATKPLFDHPATIRAPFYVDFWRLWSRGWQNLKDAPHPGQCNTQFEFHGSGPFRDFPGLFDYGPHVMAFIGDMYGVNDDRPPATRSMSPDYASLLKSKQGEIYTFGKVSAWSARVGNGSPADGAICTHSGRSVLRVGSDSRDKQMAKSLIESSEFMDFKGPVGYADDGWASGPYLELREEKTVILQHFCQSFLNDISEGFVDTRLLELSRLGMSELRKIRGMAK